MRDIGVEPHQNSRKDDRSGLILGHNVYSVVLFQLIGTILSAFFVRLEKKVTIYSHPCSQNASRVVYAPPACTHTCHMLGLSKYISKW